MTKNNVYIQPSELIFQSPGADAVMPIARLRGSQKTLNPYAIPMERWMASAAGGTSHRLNPGCATIRSFESRSLMAPLVVKRTSVLSCPDRGTGL